MTRALAVAGTDWSCGAEEAYRIQRDGEKLLLLGRRRCGCREDAPRPPSSLGGRQWWESRVENWSSGVDVAGKVDKYVVREGTLGTCTVWRGGPCEDDDDELREWEVVYWGYTKMKSLLPLDTII